MEVKKLKKIEEIYHAALEISPAERAAFLKQSCGADKNLRREVESLLSFEKSSDNFLDSLPESFVVEMFAENDIQTNLIGKEIGHYKIIKLLGKGGMGEVYLAEDTNLNRQVALKFLPAELTGNADRLKRFEREAQTASGLNHPNILTIHQFGTENNTRFIVTEFVKGVTLSAKMASGRLAISEMLDVASQVAAALAAAHEAGIIHRDIKPDNIMVRADGLVKVLDFGLAKLIESPENVRQTDSEAKTHVHFKTNPGVVMGTADYMSPEQARGKAVDAQTDIFSFGVVLFEMLTGKKPFSGETINHTIVNILEKELPSVFSLDKDCPAELEEIIRKSLEKKPDERFRTATELLLHLKKLQKRLEFEVELGLSSQPNLSDEAKTKIYDTNDVDIPVLTPNNLIENSSPIIGREKEIGEITDLLKSKNVRLLTMTGIGGTGKTRLAQAISNRVLGDFADGVFFVALAPIMDYKLVVSTIANALGVKESGGESILEVLKNYLRDKQILLVVDNFEQVIEAAPDIAELLEAGDKLKILITSREPLHLSAEREYDVLPLAVPSDETKIPLDELSKNEAVRFFVERAKFAQTNFALTDENAASIVGICRRLDGLPLAIELAAVRAKLFSPSAILTRLSDSLKLLTGGAKDLPERRQTMRGAIAWSYNLLDADEKKMLNRLAVFAGGFTVDGAEAVAFDEMPPKAGTNTYSGIDIYDGVSSLLDKSLIIRSDQADGEPRFRMLVVVQEFAFEKLEESGEAEEIKRRHSDFYADLWEKKTSQLQNLDAGKLFENFEQEHDNTRTAIDWSLDNEPNNALRLVTGNYMFWLRRGHLTEGCGWMRAALKKSGEEVNPKLRAGVNRKLAYLFRQRSDFKEAVFYGEEGLQLCRQLGDKMETAIALGILGTIKAGIGELKTARTLFEESAVIAGEMNDQRQIGHMMNSLGEVARSEKDFQAARKYYEKSRLIAKELNSSESHYPTINLAFVTYLSGDYESSRLYSLEALEISEEFGDKIVTALSLNILAALAVTDGKTKKSARLSGAADAICESIGFKPGSVDQNFIDSYISQTRTAIGDETFETAFAEGSKLSLKEAIALAREGEPDISATHTTNEANTGSTNILTNDALEAQTAILSPTVTTKEEIFHPKKSLSKIRRKKVFITALIISMLAVVSFFCYRYFTATSHIESIAVIPFVNEGNNADIEYLSDGMTETLINSLSQIPNLSVKARSSVFRYKGKEIDLKKIASELNVEAILTGRIIRSGEQVILNVELIDAKTENTLWGKRYERKLSELVALQSEVAHDVSSNLKSKLSFEEVAKVEKNHTANTEAYQLYLKGRFYWNKRSSKDFEKAIEYFSQAVEKDPNYALAYSGLADTYALMPLYGNFRPKEYLPKAKHSALKAIEFDENLAEAHASLGRILNSYDFDWKGAEREYKKAIELNPNYATAHQWYAELLAFEEMPDEALGEISKALEIDPFSLTINRMQGNILGFAKRYDEAIAQLNKTEELYPENALVRFNLGETFAAKEMYSEAVGQYLIAFRLEGETSENIQKFENAFKVDGWKGFWQEYLENRSELRKTLLAKNPSAYFNNENIAYAYAGTKNRDKVLEYLNKAYEERDPDLITIKMSGVYDFLADDPQFREFVRKIGLPE